MATDDDADDDDDDDDDGDHDADDEDADVDVDVDVDGDELAAMISHYCSSNKSKSTPVHGMWPHVKPIDLRPHGCGKPVAAMAGCHWLWKSCSCMKPVTTPRSVLARTTPQAPSSWS